MSSRNPLRPFLIARSWRAFLVAVCATLAAAPPAQAAFVLQHRVMGDSAEVNETNSGFDFDTGWRSWGDPAASGSYRQVSAYSFGGPWVNDLAHLGVQAGWPRTDDLSGIVLAGVQWADVLHINNVPSLPSSITLRWFMEGYVIASGNNAQVRVGMADVYPTAGLNAFTSFPRAEDFSGNNSEVYAHSGDSPGAGAAFLTTDNVYGLSRDNGWVEWYGKFQSSYDPELGGYPVNFLLTAWAEEGPNGDGYALADFTHTMSLVAITDGEGRDLTGKVTFESGLTFAPANVPEPSALVLCASGGLWWALGRRKRKSRQS